jgi:hypothetical protein
MSGTRFSGIAVAEANRRALVNQEREAAQRDAAHVKTLNPKEEALLASIRKQLLGGGKKKSGGGGAVTNQKSASAKPVTSSQGLSSGKTQGSTAKHGMKDGVRHYDDLDDLEDDEDEDGTRDAWDGDSAVAAERGRETTFHPPAVGEKRFLSKAERKRLKKQRTNEKASAGGTGGHAGNASGASRTETVPEKKKAEKRLKNATDDDVPVKRHKNEATHDKGPLKKKKKRQETVLRPPSPTWPPRRKNEKSPTDKKERRI